MRIGFGTLAKAWRGSRSPAALAVNVRRGASISASFNDQDLRKFRQSSSVTARQGAPSIMLIADV
jgi:hypothetical protein